MALVTAVVRAAAAAGCGGSRGVGPRIAGVAGYSCRGGVGVAGVAGGRGARGVGSSVAGIAGRCRGVGVAGVAGPSSGALAVVTAGLEALTVVVPLHAADVDSDRLAGVARLGVRGRVGVARSRVGL